MSQIILLASAEPTAKAGLFESLGINVEMLVFQTIAFLLLLWLLSKFVYPILTKMLDEREATIAEGQQAAAEAIKKANAATSEIDAQIAEAKKTAADIVEVAQKEAAKVVEEAEAKATKKAEHLLEQAEARIEGEVAAARAVLKTEMTSLVAAATEKVLGKKLDGKTDAELIREALKESN